MRVTFWFAGAVVVTTAAALGTVPLFACSHSEPDLGEGRAQDSTDVECDLTKVAWDSTVAPTARTCAGPWQYNRLVSPCYAQHQDDPACPPLLDSNGNYEYENFPDACRDYTSCDAPTWGPQTVEEPVFLLHFSNNSPTPTGLPIVTIDSASFPSCIATDTVNCQRAQIVATTVQGECQALANQWFQKQLQSIPQDVQQLMLGTPSVGPDGPLQNDPRLPSAPTSLWLNIVENCSNDYTGKEICNGDTTFQSYINDAFWEADGTFGCRTTWLNYPTSWTRLDSHVNYRNADGTANTTDPCPLSRDPYTCVDYTKIKHQPCRQPSFGPDPNPGACGATTDTYYSSPGLTLAQLKAADPAAAIVSDGAGGFTAASGTALPTCLTGEDLPMSTAQQAQTKQDQLLKRITTASTTGFPSPIDNATLLKQLVVNAKLTFEVAGGGLSGAPGDVVSNPTLGDQIAASLGLYTRYSSAPYTPTCGHSPAPPDLSKCDLSRLTTAQLNTTVAMCERLRSDHASADVRGREEVFHACMGVVAGMQKMRARMIVHGEPDDGTDTNYGADVCQFKQYRDRFDEVVTRPLREIFAAAVDPRTSSDEVARRLSRMDAWFTGVEALYPGTGTDTARWGVTSDTVGAFWRGMYRSLYPMGDPYAPPATELAAVPPSLVDGGVAGSDAAGAPEAASGGGGTAPVTADAIYAAAHDELDADRAILMSAFTPWESGIAKQAGTPPSLPLTHAPLAYVVADALQAMHQRLGDLALYHDVGCAFLGCDGQTYPSEAARLWRLVAYAADESKLAPDLSVDQVLKDETGQPVVRAQWLQVFSALSTNHAALDSAIADVFGIEASAADAGAPEAGADAGTSGPPSLVTAPIGAIPTPLVPLAMLLRDAAAKAVAYQGSGLLLGPADHLRAGAHDEYLESRRQILDGLNASLTQDVAGYRTQMQNLAQAAIQQFDFATLGAQADVNLQQTLTDIDTLQTQEAALRAGIDTADQAFAHHMDGYANLAKINPNGSVATRSVPEQIIGASAAKGTGPVSIQQNVALLSVGGAMTLAPGEILHIETSGQYAPACAIGQAPPQAIPGLNQPQAIGTANPYVGPEGYLLQVQGSSIQTQSHQDAQAHQDTNSTASTFAACGGMKTTFSWGLPGWVEAFTGAETSFEIYASLEGCYKTDTGSSDTTSSSDTSSAGADGHVSASFAAGMRLPNAPYPGVPDGALLLVLTPQGQPTVTKDVRVIQEPYTTYVADGAVDAYYVVNDLGGPGCKPDDSRTLDVKGTVLMHTGQFVSGLEPVIAKTIQSIEAQKTNIVQMGRLLPQESASLRASAYQQISAAGLDVTTFPAPVQSFLDAWIDAVLARIELEIEHNRVSLDLASKILAVKGIVEDLNDARQRGRIATLLGNWALRGLDGDAIRSDGRQVADMLLNDMYPVIKLRDRALFATLSTQDDFRNALLALIRTPWDAPIDTVGTNLSTATSDVLTGLKAVDGTKPEVLQDIVLEIPRPGNPPSTSWYVADTGRATDFWNGLSSAAHIGTITITPEDFYRVGGGLGISCAYETPVIRDMAIVLAGIDDTTAANENNRPWNAQVTTSATMLFPTGAILGSDPASNLPIVFSAGGPLTLEVTDPAWTAPLVRILFDRVAGDAVNLFEQKRPDTTTDNAARGLSPFTTFTFNMAQLWDPNLWPPPDPNVNNVNPGDAATAAEIVLRVEARSVGQNSGLSWIHECAQ